MLKGYAKHFFNVHGKHCQYYKDAVSLLGKRYNRSDKSSRILTRWKNLRISEEIEKRPGLSKMKVFLESTDECIEPKKKLDIQYHADRFMREQLLMTTHIPSVKIMLRNRVPLLTGRG